MLTDGPWPLEILAFCYSTIDKIRPCRRRASAGVSAMTVCLPTVAEKAGSIAFPADVRRQADEASLDAIRRLAARQYDKAAWCRTLAQVIDSGAYDIDRRSDLEAPLKRIFGRD